MVQLIVSRFLVLLIALGTAALLASYVGVEKEDRWRMEGPVHAVAAFPADEAWDALRAAVEGRPDAGAAVTSTSPHVVALAGRPAAGLLPGDGRTGVVPTGSAFAARAEADTLVWPGVDAVVVQDVSAGPNRAAEADLLVPALAADTSSLTGVISAEPAAVDQLRRWAQEQDAVVELVPLPSPWAVALRRSVHVPLLAVLTGFAWLGAQIVWHTTLRSRWRPLAARHRLVGASALHGALLGARPTATAWTLAAAAAAGTWLLVWPHWDREIGLTGDTLLLWAGILLADALICLATSLHSLWVSEVRL